jgi:hypothetical protein
MQQDMFDFGDESSQDVALCQCGCGQPAPLAPVSRKDRGWVKGRPVKFIWGHGRRKPGPKPGSKSNNPGGSKPRLFAEIGQRFDRGVVLNPDIRIPDGTPMGKRGVRLLCDCGNEYDADISSLFAGNVRSCGCLQREAARRTDGRKGRRIVDRIGQRFGMLTVIKFVDTMDGHARWLCHCDCGNDVVRGGAPLVNAVSCGCQLTPEGGRSAPKGKRSPGEAARWHVLRQYQKNAESRGRAWELTEEDFDRLTSSDCFYCGAPPSNGFSTGKYDGAGFIYNGIDRINNDLGYIAGNVLPCCAICNISKRARTFEEFMDWIGRLVAHNMFQPDRVPSAAIAKPLLSVVPDTS